MSVRVTSMVESPYALYIHPSHTGHKRCFIIGFAGSRAGLLQANKIDWLEK